MLTGNEKFALKQKIQANQHEIYLVSIEEMDAMIRSSPKAKVPRVNDPWQKIKGKAEVGANYAASADDIRTLGKLVMELGDSPPKSTLKTIRENRI